ncbi:MAG: glycosyltransferase family 39 protein [Lachnospiraceae bacterium]|nr:glycosyltransferase family 39 protein [Lachnospiraceae bacterium]
MSVIDKGAGLLDRLWLPALLVIFAVFCFTRFYELDKVPAGVHLDEIGYWYDAHNLAVYGTDRMGSRYPVLPASYGDGHNPMYCYMCMVMLKFFPFSVKLMRAVMGISAIPMFFASFGIIYQIYESRRWALLGPVFVTVMPYIFAANRWGLNANQMLYVCSVMLYFLIKAIKYDRLRDYILSGVFFGLSLLTYHLSYIMMPLFFVLIFVYLIIVGKFKWKNAFGAFIPFALIGMPTFIEQLINLGLVEPFYFLGSDYPRLTSYRVGEIAPINLIKNMGNIRALIFGDPVYNYNSVREFGTVYWAMIPLLFAGFITALIALAKSLKKKEPDLLSPFILYALAVYLGFISVIGCNVYKGNAIYISFIVFIVAGLKFMADRKKEVCILASLALIALSFLLYSEFYFRRITPAYGLQALFKSAEPGDMLKYEEAVYNPTGDKTVYMELNYEDRDYCEWLLALYLEIPYEEFNKYDFAAKEMFEKGASAEEVYRSVPLYNLRLAFPEEFDENEDAVYILGNNWDHISGYLTSIGFECDTTFPGYKILHR